MATRHLTQLSPDTIDVIHILVNAVRADQYMLEVEIKVIIDAAADLGICTHDGQLVSDTDFLYWLNAHFDEIAAQYDGEKRDIALVTLLSRMASRDDLKMIEKTVMDICHSDGEYHHNERMLSEMIRAYWS